MAQQQKINSLVERIVRILKKNDGLTEIFFKNIGEILVYNLEADKTETFKYDPSDIYDFFDSYESALTRRTELEIIQKINSRGITL